MIVLRRLFLCALLCLSVWTAADLLTDEVSASASFPSATSSLSGASEDTSDSDHQWTAGRRFTATTTESVWRAQLQHASLAPALGAVVFDAQRQQLLWSHPLRHAPNHPSVIPLLI
jgi:hypothetical protein